MAVKNLHNNPPIIVLVGPMGAGKSHVGRLLASKLHDSFVDADSAIEDFVQMNIPDIFEAFGEPHFRTLERAIIHNLLAHQQHRIIAFGGGAFEQSGVQNLCKHYHVQSIYLKTSPEISWERIKDSKDRPLLHVPDPITKLSTLLEQRKSSYIKADLHIITDSSTPEEVAHAIATKL